MPPTLPPSATSAPASPAPTLAGALVQVLLGLTLLIALALGLAWLGG